jgi:ribosomal protein L11 methyltransferase
MDYIEVNFSVEPISPGTDILVAFLSQSGFESFSETDAGIKAYITAESFKTYDLEKLIDELPGGFDVSFTIKRIGHQNWNEVWEKNYPPVIVKDIVYVRAPFHPADNFMKHQLLIEPKMSFGTAHHETTRLMMEIMLDEQFSGKKVLDMGCGTGILAILAEMLGSKRIIAIDNDQNAVENAIENVRKNKCKHIHVQLANATDIVGEFDYILANITKNSLMNDLHVYARHLLFRGKLICSGFFDKDLPGIKSKALASGLTFLNQQSLNHWAAACFTKSKGSR